MMNIQVNASLQAMNKNVVPPETGSGQVVLLQPAAVDETNCLQPQPQPPKRRRPKLSEEAQFERRTRIALRMREKRAGESEEQKRLRRIREAERMRRKRATEDEVQKLRRRQEAATRARNRRASMSPEERIIDRQRAADRMRLRRATESDEAKAIRRLKAAERMKKRRASETPEQRSVRRQSIALRMKARRKRRSEDDFSSDQPSEIMTRNMTSKALKSEGIRNNAVHQESPDPVTNMNTDQSPHISTSQLVTPTSHILVPSNMGVRGSIAVLEVDPTLPPMSLGNSVPGLSTVDVTQLSQPLPLHKSVSTTQEQERPQPLSLQKHVAVSQESSTTAAPTPVSTPLSSMNASSHSSLEPIPLHKTTNYHHHLPHLLHYHQHHTCSPQHQHQHQHQHHHQHLQQRHPHQ